VRGEARGRLCELRLHKRPHPQVLQEVWSGAGLRRRTHCARRPDQVTLVIHAEAGERSAVIGRSYLALVRLQARPTFRTLRAWAHCHSFFAWYNAEHHHSGLGLLTPADVHDGLAEQRVAARATVLSAAYATHPERFPSGLPRPPARPLEVWINAPKTREHPAVRLALVSHSRNSSQGEGL
jgi:hypothetical protein